MRPTLPLILLGLCCEPALAQAIRVADVPPMRWVEQLTPEALPPLKYPEYADVLDRARMQLAAGRYRLAIQTLNLASGVDEAQRLELLGEASFRDARFDEAIAILGKPLLADRPIAIRLRARALEQIGRRDDAIALISSLVDKKDASPITHALLGQLYANQGQLSQAKAAWSWFLKQQYLEQWQQDELAKLESADDLVAIASGLDRLAVLDGLYRARPELHQTILAMFVRAYDTLDRRNADAHVLTAAFFAAHDDEDNAREELTRALALNPNHVDALAAMGELALGNYNFSAAEQAIASIRSISETHPAGILLTARLQLMQRQPDDAQATLAPLLARDPRNATALSLAAAGDALKFDAKSLDARLKAIDATMPESSEAYVTAGELLLPAFQFKESARLLEVAIQRTPHWNQPRNLLALAYMQQPDVDKARPVLEEAHALDPYNVSTTNYLRLLDTLAGYQLKRSAHFAVRSDPKSDPFLADEVLSYMEENYGRICQMYEKEPSEPTIIELMPTSEDFAVRTTGKPWIGTIGASTGPVITMVAPRPSGKTNGPFDWCDVARHEFTHTVTLAATNQRMPRWFTEGLAVSEQACPLSYDHATLLASAAESGHLFPLRRLNWAFIHPIGKRDTDQAYAQSYLLCRYLHEKYGHQAVLDLASAYRDGLQTEQAVQRSLHLSTPELDIQFAQWTKAYLKRLGLDATSQAALAALKQLAEPPLANKQYDQALPLWEKAYALCPVDPTVHQRLAGLYLHKSINQPEKALPHLHALDAEQLKDNRYAIRLARLYEQLGKLPEASRSARRATELNPYDKNAREIYARVLEAAGDKPAANRQREILALIP